MKSLNIEINQNDVKENDKQAPQDDSSILDSLKVENEKQSSEISTRRG